MQGVAQKQFDDHFLRLDLGGQAPQARLVLIGRRTHHELLAEVFGEFLLQAECRLIVDPVVRSEDRKGFSQVFLRQALHADE